MNLPNPPDGLLVMSDRVAFGAMHALKQRGLRIPDDVAVASFNNEPTCDYLTPSLTSVSWACGCCSNNSTPKFFSPKTTTLPTQLVVRGIVFESIKSFHRFAACLQNAPLPFEANTYSKTRHGFVQKKCSICGSLTLLLRICPTQY